MPVKVKEARKTIQSLIHVLNGYDNALACLKQDNMMAQSHLSVLRNYIEKEFDRLEKGLAPITEVNHQKTKK